MSNVFQNLQLQRIADSLSGGGGAIQLALGVEIPEMEGATATADGKNGVVPAPLAGDESKFLSGAGTWEEVGGGGGAEVITRHIVETGEKWDGNTVYCAVLNASGMSNGSGSNFQFETFGMTTPTIQGIRRIELIHIVNGYWANCSGIFWDNNTKYIRGNLASPLNGSGTLYIFIFFY